jgi:hypothetical protein
MHDTLPLVCSITASIHNASTNRKNSASGVAATNETERAGFCVARRATGTRWHRDRRERSPHLVIVVEAGWDERGWSRDQSVRTMS